MDGDDFDGARQSSRGPAEHGGGEDDGADRQADYLGGANVAADDVDGEADDRVSHEHPRDHARDDAEDEAPVDAGGRDRADHQALADGPRRGLEHLAEIADGPGDEVVHHGDGDVVQEQRRDRLVDAAPVPERAGHSDPEAATESTGQAHQRDRERWRQSTEVDAGEHGRHAPDDQRALAADHQQSRARGQRRAERGEHDRRGLGQRLFEREPGAEAAGDEGRVNVERVEAAERDEPAEDPEGGQQGGGRDGRRLRPRRAPHAVTS